MEGGSRAKPPERHGKLATCVSARGARAAGSAGAFPLARGRGAGGAAVVVARERNNVSLTGHGRHEEHADGFAGRQRQVRTADALVVSRRKFTTQRAGLFARLSSVE